MSPLDGEARPLPKSAQVAPRVKKYRRTVAGPKRWAQIAAAKQGPCRVTGAPPPNQLAHLISRAQGGPDTEWNIVPLSVEAHILFDARDPDTCRKVALSLTDQEYAGLVEHAGEQVFERRFGIVYSRAGEARAPSGGVV